MATTYPIYSWHNVGSFSDPRGEATTYAKGYLSTLIKSLGLFDPTPYQYSNFEGQSYYYACGQFHIFTRKRNKDSKVFLWTDDKNRIFKGTYNQYLGRRANGSTWLEFDLESKAAKIPEECKNYKAFRFNRDEMGQKTYIPYLSDVAVIACQNVRLKQNLPESSEGSDDDDESEDDVEKGKYYFDFSIADIKYYKNDTIPHIHACEEDPTPEQRPFVLPSYSKTDEETGCFDNPVHSLETLGYFGKLNIPADDDIISKLRETQGDDTPIEDEPFDTSIRMTVLNGTRPYFVHPGDWVWSDNDDESFRRESQNLVIPGVGISGMSRYTREPITTSYVDPCDCWYCPATDSYFKQVKSPSFPPPKWEYQYGYRGYGFIIPWLKPGDYLPDWPYSIPGETNDKYIAGTILDWANPDTEAYSYKQGDETIFRTVYVVKERRVYWVEGEIPGLSIDKFAEVGIPDRLFDKKTCKKLENTIFDVVFRCNVYRYSIFKEMSFYYSYSYTGLFTSPGDDDGHEDYGGEDSGDNNSSGGSSDGGIQPASASAYISPTWKIDANDRSYEEVPIAKIAEDDGSASDYDCEELCGEHGCLEDRDENWLYWDVESKAKYFNTYFSCDIQQLLPVSNDLADNT